MTNRERLNKMSNNKLAKILAYGSCEFCIYGVLNETTGSYQCGKTKGICNYGIEKWLESNSDSNK